MELKKHIVQYLNKLFDKTDYFVVDVKTGANAKITAFIDGKNDITIDKCVEISRALEHFLEENNLVPEKYLLEVSSPGIDQPLKVSPQFEKAIGKKVAALLNNGERLEGTLMASNDEKINLQIEKKKKGKIIEKREQELTFEEIKSISRVINF